MVACKLGHVPILKYLFSKGGNINEVNINDDTVLSIAVRN
jgi:ankyrin repeat protein